MLAQPRRVATEPRNSYHPWLILADEDRLETKVFVSCLVTHAEQRANDERTDAPYQELQLLKDGAPYIDRRDENGQPIPSQIDHQNIWTLTIHHIDYDEPRVLELGARPTSRQILDRVARSFAGNARGTRKPNTWDVGRLCTVDFIPSRGRRHGDLTTLAATLTANGVRWEPSWTSLRCVIAASDQEFRYGGQSPWRAVTVVPLLESAKLGKHGAPWVTVPGPPDETGLQPRLHALTLLLMTVHYGHVTSRVRPGAEGFPKDFQVSETEMNRILADIRKVIG